jgi:hypothetical protein
VRVEGEGQMRGMVTKEEAACNTSVSFKINVISKFLEHSKFGWLTASGTFKSFGGGYRVSHGSPLLISSNQTVSVSRYNQSESQNTKF